MSEGWIKLSDRQPAIGTLCKWWVVSGQVDDNGEGHYMRVTTTINGQEVGANGFSCKGKGMMISPPEHTYWKEGAMTDIQKTIQTLRDFNLWRKGDDAMEQPDPWGIGKAIDEAIEAMEKLGRLTDAALAVVDRWETPFWKQVEHTGVCIAALRKALEEVEGGPQ